MGQDPSYSVFVRSGCLLLLALVLLACSRVVPAMDVPTDWIRIEADGRFTFWLPPGLLEQDTRGIDSYVRRWESQNMLVHFDYGRFSDPLTLYSAQKGYEATTTRVSGYPVRIVSFERDNGWRFTAVHFSDLGQDTAGQVVKLTLVVESSPQVAADWPSKIVKSVVLEDEKTR
jgi:hypothetical protein